ncbi:MAG: FRG domain-containing protein [Candidatus Gracilibacteria bacterium]
MIEIPKFIFRYGKQIELYDKENCIKEIIINSIDDIKKNYDEESIYSFRGQSNSNWKLTTTIERNCTKNISLFSLENQICQIYLKSMDKKNIEFDDIVNIQHYGGPTRLLDWTESFDTALFFV